MFAANASRSRLSLRHALAGLQAGIFGALTMLAFLMAGSAIERHSPWLVPNLFASVFYGSDVYLNRFLHTSWSGLALVLALYGCLGAMWGCIWRDRGARWLAFYGALFGLAVYYITFHFLWKRVSPMMFLYAPDRQLEVGHIIWGMVLARAPRYARSIAARTSTPAETIYEAEEPVRYSG